jgi:MFS-type transporter involved in bile tolerance (Atg22 family)
MPKGSNYFTVGFKQVWLALREIRSLPQTFLYFVAFFLFADGLNTTGMISYHFHWSDCIYKKMKINLWKLN